MTPKRIAFYTRDTGDPDNTADHQSHKLQTATQDENAQMVRDYVDHRDMSLHRMLAEATEDTSPCDKLQVTNLSHLGDTDEQIQSRLTELADNGVHVRIAGDSSPPPQTPRE